MNEKKSIDDIKYSNNNSSKSREGRAKKRNREEKLSSELKKCVNGSRTCRKVN